MNAAPTELGIEGQRAAVLVDPCGLAGRSAQTMREIAGTGVRRRRRLRDREQRLVSRWVEVAFEMIVNRAQFDTVAAFRGDPDRGLCSSLERTPRFCSLSNSFRC